jgi:hypothetical protein
MQQLVAVFTPGFPLCGFAVPLQSLTRFSLAAYENTTALFIGIAELC